MTWCIHPMRLPLTKQSCILITFLGNAKILEMQTGAKKLVMKREILFCSMERLRLAAKEIN